MTKRFRFRIKIILGVFVVLFSTSTMIFAFSECDVSNITAAFDVPVLIEKQSSISDIEKQRMKKIFVDGNEIELPFGAINGEWEILKSLYQEGDCIVFFRTGPETWKGLYGREGYILVRDGEPVYTFVTMLN